LDKLIVLTLSLITNGLIIYFSSWILKHYRYEGIQSIHQGIIPRLGGISIYFGLVISIFIGLSITQNFIVKISLALLPLFLVSLREDLKHDVRPVYRLLVAILSALIMVYFFGALKNIDLPFLPTIVNSSIFLILLTLLAFTAITHAFNMIDGLNGLAIFVYWSILGCLYFMSHNLSDQLFKELTFLGLFIPLGFFIFNYPFGKIFLGDTGAYILGFICAAMTIYFFNQNPQLMSWQAILILIYPITEVIYSFVRRLAKGISPLHPDDQHLHTFMYRHLKEKKYPNESANNLATIMMLPFIGFGPAINLLLPVNLISIFLVITFYLICYIKTYKYLVLNT
jgi:UDP-GlcNAc:undecaprenyl-phosphate/decaprenyl-phosphate GlcNAc-1-phosphate transferase